jgi:hypothetical protein
MPETLRATDPLAGDWILLVMLAALGMLGWINLVSPKKWRLLTRSFFSLRLGRQTLRDELDLQDRTLIGLAVMASAALALFGYQFTVLVAHLPPGIGLWAKLFGVFLLLLVAQVLLVRLAGRLFQADGGLSEYLYTLLLLHVVLGVALLPVTASIAWPHDVTISAARPDEMVWRIWGLRLGMALVALVTAFRWVRAAVLGLGEGVPLRYILIYLCALEILPVALACQQALRLLPDPSHPI